MVLNLNKQLCSLGPKVSKMSLLGLQQMLLCLSTGDSRVLLFNQKLIQFQSEVVVFFDLRKES